ncbi:hypothetical protein [Chryseobacterium sp. SL1]|uniref:hypothetical protein n=1 Tax=Chryseobacterium sp. SL1 TaxID=2995159 RepID=UPI0022735C0A|nr:hypothetical protein [Chryseobacterium sp. SL1]MCY1662567.1 hypothetical protein [Chryseobacterium sp. SL1]
MERLNNVEKGKLLADLLPEELPEIVRLIEQETKTFLQNEADFKANWKSTLVTAEFWFSLVRNIDNSINKCGSRLHKNNRWFADQLFDGYNALFTIYCLVEYSLKEECNHKLRQGIHFLFGDEPLILKIVKNTNHT